MNITFYGAARTVTGSQHLLETNGLKILLDCGFFQGKRAESQELNRNFSFDPASLDILILSHAHIDHSGNIPQLIKHGFKGDIICTAATRDLASIMLKDSAHIQEQDTAYLNKKRIIKGLPPLEPLYTKDDAVKCMANFVGISYNRTRKLAPGVYLTLKDAGHILGSSFIHLQLEDENGSIKLLYSGDLGRKNRPIIRDPEKPEETDILILESTYGDRLHEDESSTEKKLAEIINQIYKDNGKLIVPAFAVGRTQDFVYRINRLIQAKAIPDNLPVYIDSPLAIEATAIFQIHPEDWDAEASAFYKLNKGKDPFGFPFLRFSRTVEESKELNNLKGPAIIISASGMAETGRILHHLKNNIEKPSSAILFIGYQAANTLGRKLVEKASQIKIFDNEYKVKAKIEVLEGLSAHADKSEILEWLKGLSKIPAQTFLVHGEESAALALKESLKAQGWGNIEVPYRGQNFGLTTNKFN